MLGLRNLSLHTSVSVQKIERDDTRGSATCQGGDPVEFDAVILASPLKGSLEFLDACADERGAFWKIRSFAAWQAIVEADGLSARV